MTKIETKLEMLREAMEYTGDNPPEHTRANIYLITDKCDSGLKSVLMGLIYDENIGGTHDLGYEIASQAIDILVDNSEDGSLDEDDLMDLCTDSASPYNNTRLSYLNIFNEHEITDRIKDFSCDINTACAIWYDNMVYEAVTKLFAWVMEDEEND